MELYLMQHGTCLPKELDPNQELSPVGWEQVEKSGRAIQAMGISFDLIIASSKLRAQQTADLIAREQGYARKNILVTDVVKAMAPPEDALDLLTQQEQMKRVLIVGHLPSINHIISLFITKEAKAAVHIENGGLVRLDITDFHRPAGQLMYYLTPYHLKRLAP